MAGGTLKLYVPKKSTKSKKRSTRSNRFKAGALNLITKNINSGLPDSVVMKHKYTESYNVATTTTASSNIFRLNSLYDADLTGIGHQPYYRDQMASLYNAYCVYGCKVKVTGICGGNQAIVGFVGQQDQTGTANALLQTERPQCKYMLLNGNGSGKSISRYFDMSKCFGVTKSNYLSEEDFQALGNADPQRVWFLDLFGQHPDSTSTANINMLIELTFYVRWSDRIRQTQS